MFHKKKEEKKRQSCSQQETYDGAEGGKKDRQAVNTGGKNRWRIGVAFIGCHFNATMVLPEDEGDQPFLLGIMVC